MRKPLDNKSGTPNKRFLSGKEEKNLIIKCRLTRAIKWTGVGI